MATKGSRLRWTLASIILMGVTADARAFAAQQVEDTAVQGSAKSMPSATPVAATRIRLMVMREVNSSSARAGDVVKLSVDQPFEVDGVVVPAGTPAFGTVRDAKDAGAALQRGKLDVQLSHIALGERQLRLRGDLLDRGEGGKSDDAAKVLLAPIYILFARGNVAKLRAGEIVYGELASVTQQ